MSVAGHSNDNEHVAENDDQHDDRDDGRGDGYVASGVEARIGGVVLEGVAVRQGGVEDIEISRIWANLREVF